MADFNGCVHNRMLKHQYREWMGLNDFAWEESVFMRVLNWCLKLLGASPCELFFWSFLPTNSLGLALVVFLWTGTDPDDFADDV